MIREQRRLELEKLAAAVNAAHDRYYCEMDEADFADEFAEFADDDGEDEVYTAWYRAILRQREIGFDAFAAEVRQAFDNAAPTGEELHELMAHYNITTTTARVCPHGSSPIPPARWPPRSRCTGCATPPPFTKTTARRKTPPPAASVTILRN